jgi:hypothetical protein
MQADRQSAVIVTGRCYLVLDKGLGDPHVSNCINIGGGTHASATDASTLILERADH